MRTYKELYEKYPKLEQTITDVQKAFDDYWRLMGVLDDECPVEGFYWDLNSDTMLVELRKDTNN